MEGEWTHVRLHAHRNAWARLVFKVYIILAQKCWYTNVHSTHGLIKVSIVEICVENDEILQLDRDCYPATTNQVKLELGTIQVSIWDERRIVAEG